MPTRDEIILRPARYILPVAKLLIHHITVGTAFDLILIIFHQLKIITMDPNNQRQSQPGLSQDDARQQQGTNEDELQQEGNNEENQGIGKKNQQANRDQDNFSASPSQEDADMDETDFDTDNENDEENDEDEDDDNNFSPDSEKGDGRIGKAHANPNNPSNPSKM